MSSSTPILTTPSWAPPSPGAGSTTAASATNTALSRRITRSLLDRVRGWGRVRGWARSCALAAAWSSLPQFFDLSRRIRTLTVMLYDPGVWLFGLAVGLFLAGILGVVLSTRRVPPNEAQEVPGIIADPGSELELLEERRAHLVTTGDDGEHRGGGG